MNEDNQDQAAKGTTEGAPAAVTEQRDQDVVGLGGGEAYRFRIADYANLLKPRVMMLVVFTAVTGLVIAPGQIRSEERRVGKEGRSRWWA